MKNSTNQFNRFLGKTICKTVGHQYVKTKNITHHIKEYECKVCKCQATNDIKGNVISLSPQLREINETLQYLYPKKTRLQTYFIAFQP